MQAHYFRHISLLVATAFTMSGCARIPDLGHLLSLRQMPGFQTEKTIGGGRSEWPTDQWWLVYNDAQLDRLIRDSFENSPSIEQAAARVKQSQALAQQYASTLYPQIDLNATVEKTKQSYNNGVPSNFVPHGFQNIGRATVDINYQLDFWGKNRSNLEAAISTEKAADLQASQARLTLAADMAESYGQLAQLYASLDAAQNALKVRNKTTRLFKDRLDNGLENEGIYDEQISLQAAAQADIEQINESIELTKNNLAALTGLGPDRALSITRPDLSHFKSFGLPKNVPAELIGRRPDVLAAKFIAMAGAKRIDAAQADFYPNVNLAAYFGQQSLGLDLFAKQGSFVGQFGPALSLPIFDGGRLRGAYQQAAAEYEISVAQYNNTITRALNEISDAAVSQKALGPRTRAIQKAAAASDKSYQAALNRYKGGLSTYLDVLRAEDTVINNRRALADIKTRGFALDVEMVRALGGGFVDTQQQ